LIRPADARRSWLFVPGADAAAQDAVADCGADVLIQELEDFTAPARRPEARALAAALYDRWREAGVLATVRVNPLAGDGIDDLEAVMRGRPDAVLLPKVAEPEHVAELDREVSRLELALGIEPGTTELVPNIESAAGLIRTHAIVTASPRVRAALVASEDMAADLGAERGPDGTELAYARARFHVECTAAGVMAIDCPFTWDDPAGLEAETRHARRLGYRAKSAVVPEHCPTVNALLTPQPDEVAHARRVVDTYETAQAQGAATVELDGRRVELPTYLSAKRLLERAEALGVG